MNTNTVEQARRLKDFKIWYKRQFTFVGGENRGWKPGTFSDTASYESSTSFNNFQGPALTLDELHRVFTSLELDFWPMPMHDVQEDCDAYQWSIYYDFTEKRFFRTTNHAEDWTVILIWLLEEGHVTAEQVNSILKGTE